MKIAVLIDDFVKEEWRAISLPDTITILETTDFNEFCHTTADVYFDWLFVNNPSRIKQLNALCPAFVFINCVESTLNELNSTSLIRINGWNTFINRKFFEIAISSFNTNTEALKQLPLTFQITPDTPGMLSARVVAMIINEAYFALGEGVSSKIEIDTAMKLGTNYPFGPFEWSEKIGLEKIYRLLKKLQAYGKRYTIAPALEKEIITQQAISK